jgi:ankyrin repeat protein
VVITEEVVKAAATSGQEQVLKLLETLGDRFNILPSKRDWSIAYFYNAAKSGKLDVIRKLLADGINPDLKNLSHISPLWIATDNNYLEVVQILLATKLVNVNLQSLDGRSPLFLAAASGSDKMVQLLLREGADPHIIDANGDTASSIAKLYRYQNIVKMLAGE